MAEKALTAVTQEANVKGFPTPLLDDLVQTMQMPGVSNIQVSRPCSEIGEKNHSFLDRLLEHLHREIKRQANVGGIFPNWDAITYLIGVIHHEQHDE